ncbi:MAG: hypothetical protein JW986_03415 [Methanotrichaceae archaeon]|nr:hypothetical protein [Methanotrichaceae archaeon]
MFFHALGDFRYSCKRIGDAIFRADQDGIVDVDDAAQGTIAAADSIDKKYLEPKVYSAIQSPRYLTILEKMAAIAVMKPTFQRRDVDQRLSSDKKKVLDNCLRKMKDLGALSRDADGYSFVNDLYPLYVLMERDKNRPPHRQKND